MTPGAARQRLYRARRRQGESSITDALLAAGRLGEWDEGDPAAIGRAVAMLLRDFVASVDEHGCDPLRRKT